MRIMYKNLGGSVVVKEVTSAYTWDANKLTCDSTCDSRTFQFENAMPYQDKSVDDLLMMLLREGFLDLRSLRLVI